jgi:hypothetical protein
MTWGMLPQRTLREVLIDCHIAYPMRLCLICPYPLTHTLQLLSEYFADASAIISVYPKAWMGSIAIIDYDGKRVEEPDGLIVGE